MKAKGCGARVREALQHVTRLVEKQKRDRSNSEERYNNTVHP
jgi:hypothetical protein